MKTINKEIIKDLVAVTVILGGLALLAKSCERKEEPINTSPEISEKRIVFTRDQDTGIQFTVQENGRQIFFYDHSYDGTLDEVGIGRGWGVEYSTHNPKELKKWISEYERIRKQRTGEFQPIYESKEAKVK